MSLWTRLGHGRWSERTSLLVLGTLDVSQRERALEHLRSCARCRDARTALERVLGLMAQDPALRAEPPIPVSALATRVRQRLSDPRPSTLRSSWGPVWIAAGAVAVLAVALMWRQPALVAPGADGEPAGEEMLVSEEALRRMERSVAREGAVRYLGEAQDVLVTVASTLPFCDRGTRLLNVADEARRSRELLARRTMLVDTASDDVASARPVLEDVDQFLREVATFEACARASDLVVFQGALERRRLLMKIDLVTRELAG